MFISNAFPFRCVTLFRLYYLHEILFTLFKDNENRRKKYTMNTKEYNEKSYLKGQLIVDKKTSIFQLYALVHMSRDKRYVANLKVFAFCKQAIPC